MPNLSNYGNKFLTFYAYSDISEKNMLILFIFGIVINNNSDFMHVKYILALCQCVAFMSIISYIFYVCGDIFEIYQWILVMLSIVIETL